MGNPVAFEASAELLDTRGFISMTTMSPLLGSTPNWTFEPPVSTPISRMIRTPASRMRWYSLSESVIAGATVILSPVCTPIGSRFSIGQTMTTLSLRSRITSSSYSFHPIKDSSIRSWPTGLMARPHSTIFSNSSRLYAIFPPVPPMVNDGRRITGNSIRSRILMASSRLCATPLAGTRNPIRCIACLKASRSSAL